MDNRFFSNVAMYLRKSRAEEGEPTQVVLARHKAQLTRFANEHNINVVKIYEEVVSGDSLFSRPEMIELLKDIESGCYSGVLCTDIDRLGRGNMKEQGMILETFKDSGTAIITPDKIYDLNNEFDETQSEFKTFIARQELKIIKKRLSRGIRLTIEKGGYVSNPPFGYVRAYKEKIPTLAPSPEEAEYVKLIFKLYIDGCGCETICRKLSSMGVKPHRGDKFSRNSIRKIISNPVYIGKVVWGQRKSVKPHSFGEKRRTEIQPRDKWLMFDGLHPAIIDKDVFERANRILKSRYHAPYRKNNEILNPFAGILICRRCGCMMTRRVLDRSSNTEYLLCPNAGCMKSARSDYVEQAVINVLKNKLNDIEISRLENPKQSEPQSDIIICNMQNELKKLRRQYNSLYELLEQGVYSVSVYTQREKLLSEQIETLSGEIKSLREKSDEEKQRAEAIAPQIKHVLQEYWSGTPAQKNQLLKSVVERAYYYKPKNAPPKGFTIEIVLKE
jgi:site-specific DNA recombinase